MSSARAELKAKYADGIISVGLAGSDTTVAAFVPSAVSHLNCDVNMDVFGQQCATCTVFTPSGNVVFKFETVAGSCKFCERFAYALRVAAAEK